MVFYNQKPRTRQVDDLELVEGAQPQNISITPAENKKMGITALHTPRVDTPLIQGSARVPARHSEETHHQPAERDLQTSHKLPDPSLQRLEIILNAGRLNAVDLLIRDSATQDLLWQPAQTAPRNHIGTHNTGIFENVLNHERIFVKYGPEHTQRAEFTSHLLLRLCGVAVPEQALNKTSGSTALVMEVLEGFTTGMRLPQSVGSSPAIAAAFLVDLLTMQYDRVAWNIMWSEHTTGGAAPDVRLIDHGASLGSRARGGYNGIPPEISAEQILATLSNPQFGGLANPAYGDLIDFESAQNGKIVVKNPEVLRKLLNQIGQISDAAIEIIAHQGFGDITIEESQKDLRQRLRELATQRDTKSISAYDTITTILNEWDGNQAGYLAWALKSRRDSIVRFFETEAIWPS